uniref:Polymorphic membrane protein n=1 Tax=Solibacter usitatus (strain Ellin6076) TaxID=234267 RepID=Q02CP8_SOLUE
MNRKKLIILTAFFLTTVVTTGVFTTLSRFRTPAQVHAQDGRPQLYLNRAVRIDSHFNAGSIDGAMPLSMASDDFDGDGIHDLAVGLSTARGGAIALHHGNLDAFAPQSDASFSAIARSEFPSPYLREGELVTIPSRPDFLAAGDFIGLNGPGVVAAARGGRTLHVVSRGDSGKLEVLQSLDVAGVITGVDQYQLRPGKYAQLVVGVRGESGPELRVYDGSQAGLAEVSRFPLAGDATAFAFGNLDGDLAADVLMVAGGELYVLHGGNQALEHVRLPFHPAAVALGSFAYDRDSLLSMAVLATDGSLHILVNNQYDPRPITTEELRALRQSRRVRQTARVLPRQRPVSWKEIESFPGVATVDASGRKPVMFRTRISSNALDDVMLLDAARLTVLTHPDANPTAGLLLTRSDLGADAAAAISERVNIDGRPGVVFTKNGDVAPYVMMPLPDPTFTVNRTDDPAPPSPISSACNGVANDCSLRSAILKANATIGTDTIMVPAGTYTLTRARSAGIFNGQQGTLEVTDSVNIVGAGMATTIIQGGSSLASSVDKVFSFNQDISAFTTATVSVSNLTIQFGNNRGNVIIQDGWGGAFDFDTGGSNAATATATLTLTNVNLANNQTTDGEGGGFAIFNTNQGSGNATLTNSIVQSNKAQRSASSDPNGPGNGGGIAVLWPATLTMSNTQVLNNTATLLGSGAGTGGGLYALGGGGASNSVTMHGGSVSGNTAPGDGGGIYSTAGLTINQGAVINNNTANGSGGGIWYNGDPGNPATLNKVTITGNQAKGTATLSAGDGGGIHVGSAGLPLSISFSRIALNTAKSGGSQLHNQPSGGAGSAVTASNNWWGTNTPGNVISPATSTCAAGAFQVCFNPFIKLTFSPSATPILVGGTSTLTASFLKDSANNAVSAANLDVMAGLPITFSNNQHGTLSGAQSAIQNVQSVASATESGNTVTITTSAPHGFANGQTVTISAVGVGYDGQFTVGGAGGTTFTYTSLSSGLVSLGAGGTATVPVGTATVTFAGTTVGPGTADAVIDGFTLTSSPIIAVNSPTTTAAANQTATYNDSNQNVTLSANITAICCTVAGGTVTFTVFDSGNNQVGVPATSSVVVGGNASATYVLPGHTGAATYNIHATYNGTSTGTGDFLTSSDNTKTLTVNAAPTTTTVTNATAIFSASNQPVTLSAAVTSANGIVGAGTVTFTVFDSGSNQVGLPVTSGTVTSGAASATFTLPGSTPIGSYSIHASYSGSTNFLSSNDNAHTLTVNANTTTTASPASATFSASSQVVALSATVTSAGGTVNAGTVTFTVFNASSVQVGSATPGTVSGGSASANFTLPAGTAAGTYSIHASYGGSGNFLASSDNTQNLTVNAAGTTTTAANATANFSASNQGVTLSATVTSPSGTVSSGTVTFTVFNSLSVQVGVAATSGTVSSGNASASFTLPGGSAAGVYSIHATYNGTTNLLASSDNTHTLSVNASTTTTAAPASVIFSTSTQTVPLSATVTSAGGQVNAGTVTFTLFDSGNAQVGSPVTSGTVTAGAASANFTLPASTPAGTYSIHASYSGAGNFAASSDNTHNLTVAAPSATTTTVVPASASFSTSSQSVPFSATVTSAGGTVNAGTVTFTVFNSLSVQVGAATPVAVSSGSASANFALPASTPAGTYSIHASYSGGGTFAASSDNAHNLTVGTASTTVAAVSTSKTYSTASQSVALSATVSSASPVNEGTVTFTIKNGPTTIGAPVTSATVSGGSASATFTLPASTPATIYTIQAVYNPGTDFGTNSDSTHTLTVGKATPVITWANPVDILFGGALSPTQLNATASTPGSFIYTPALGTVLPVGNAQALSVSFTPTDTTDFNGATAGVLINVLPAPGPATLIMTPTLARDSGTNEVVITVTLANTGGTAATGVQVTSAKIGAISTTAVLPAPMPDVPAGGSSSVVLRFPGSVGTAGARVVLAVSAASSAGTLTASSRVVLP